MNSTPLPGRRRWFASFLSAATSLVLLAAPALASTLVVDTVADTIDAGDEHLSLREAIIQANTDGGDTITFDETTFAPAGGPYTIQLTSALPDLDAEVTITGPGAKVLTVRGQGDSANSADYYRLFHVKAGRTVVISGLKLANGRAAGANGVAGTATGTGAGATTVTNPSNGLPGLGGAIWNEGTLTVTGCFFQGNAAQGGAGGVGAGDTNQAGGVGANGMGGAIHSTGPALTITGCSFVGNTATGGSGGNGGSIQFAGGASGTGSAAGPAAGGAVFIGAAATISITNSTFATNSAQGGSGGSGGSSNFGNGALNPGGAGGDASGGAIYSGFSLAITSCTFALNGAAAGTGGLEGANFTNAAPGQASGGALFSGSGANVTVGNTLIAANLVSAPSSGTAQGPDAFGTFTSRDFNLVGIATGATVFGATNDQTGTLAAPLDAKLDPSGAQDNGGQTPTVRLRRGSPAVDKGKDLDNIGVDQAGHTRPLDLSDTFYPNTVAGDASDIGAYEVPSLPDDAPVTQDQSIFGTVGVAFAQQRIQATDADNDPLTFSLLTGNTMPAGLTLNADGTITGTPTAAGVKTVSFKVSDGLVETTPHTLTINIAEVKSLVVNTDLDTTNPNDGLTSLREAIAYVASGQAPSTSITFDATFFASPRTITVLPTSGPLVVSTSLTITGPTAALTVSGGDLVRVFTFNGGTSLLTNFTIAHGHGSGGAVTLENGTPEVTLRNCTLSDNAADDARGGAVVNAGGDLTLVNCTLANNHADDLGSGTAGGGALASLAGNTQLYNCTIAFNHSNAGQGGGVYVGGGTVTLANSIIAKNTADNGTGPDLFGAFTTSGFNLLGSIGGATIAPATTDQVGIDPGFAVTNLADNGGSVKSIALATGSPAIDQGKAFGNSTTEAHGKPRTYDNPAIPNAAGGDGTDIGAYEVPAPPAPEISLQQPAGNELVDGTSTVDFGNVGSTVSKDLVFTIKNAGDLTLNLNGSPLVLITGTDAAAFNVATQPATVVAPGATTTFTLRFTPGALGPKTASISITSDDADENPFTVTVTGTGVDALTQAPTVTSPAAGSSNKSPISVSFNLPEAAFAGSVKLILDNGTAHVFPLAGEEAMGVHTVTFDATANGLADGTYTLKIAYKDALGNPEASSAGVSIKLDNAPPVITGNFSPLFVYLGTPLPNYGTLATSELGVTYTQVPAVGTAANTLGLVHVTLTGTDPAGNQSSIQFDVEVRPVNSSSASILKPGDTVPGAGDTGAPPADTKILTFREPSLDSTGNYAFYADWTSPTAGRGNGIFTNLTAVAQKGGDVPTLTGAKYLTFGNPLLVSDYIGFTARLSGVPAAKANVLMHGLPNDLTPIAKMGTPAPDAAGADLPGGILFRSITGFAINGKSVALLAELTGGTGAVRVNATNSTGIWLRDLTHTLRLVLREGQQVAGKTVKTITAFSVGNGSPGQGRGWLTVGAGGTPKALARVVFTDNTQGILAADFTGVTAYALANVAGTSGPALSGAKFNGFGMPAVNELRHSAFMASMKVGFGNVVAADATGIFADNGGTTFATVARQNSIAGATGATFAAFKDVVLDDSDGLAFPATLRGGLVRGLGINTIWYKPAGGTLALFAQGGARPGQDLPPEAQFASFQSLGSLPYRGPILSATMVVNRGGVTAATARGVWAADFTHTPRLLFRTGVKDAIITGKTLKTFTLLDAVAGTMGVTRSFNKAGEVIWLATFTDRTQAIIRSEVP